MYPFSNLAIIAPIIFIVLLVITPIIGACAGWKRAAFWAGGNFIFYSIGLIIWTFAGTAITKSLQPTLLKLVSSLTSKIKASDLITLSHSLVTPVFFILVLLASNLILLINYYAWFKKVVGLKKSKAEKAAIKAAKAQGKSVAKVKLQYHPKANKVYNKRWFNAVIGGVGMEILMLPTIFTFTQAVYFGTTSAKTRAANKFSNSIYNMLQGASKKLDWFSYYTGEDTGKDFDAIFSLLSLSGDKISYIDPETGTTATEDKTPIEALTDSVSKGMKNIVSETTSSKVSLESQETIKPLTDSITKFSKSFDSIVEQCTDDVETVFNSPGVTEVIKGIIGDDGSKGGTPISSANFDDQFKNENSVFNTMVKAYENGGKIVTADGQTTEFEIIQNPIGTSETAFNNIVESVYSNFNVSELDSEQQAIMKEKTKQLVSMMVYVK